MEKKTKMGCMQLAIVFVPNVIKSPDLDINPSLAIINMNPEKDFLTMLITKFHLPMLWIKRRLKLKKMLR